MDALVSIHDVMPSTLGRVRELLAQCHHHGIDCTTLLVVPGRDWYPHELEQLRAWQAAGHELAAHGWSHEAIPPNGLYHRLHAHLISRDCAEHLSRKRHEVLAVMRASHAWFARNGLEPPSLYVPPAWALGAIAAIDLANLPYAQVETLAGLWGAEGGRTLLPLLGYEADTPWRAAALRVSNTLARQASRWRPLRVAIHPDDARLHLANDLERDLARTRRALVYRDLLSLDNAGGSRAANAALVHGPAHGRPSVPNRRA